MSRRHARHLTVGRSAAGQPLLAFLRQTLPPSEAPRAETFLRRGAVWLGKHRIIDPHRVLAAGDTVLVCLPPTGSYDEVELTPAQVVYHDRQFLVVDKPSGWYSQMTPWDIHGNLEAAVRRFLAMGGRDPEFLHQVNRLDRETSGLLLFTLDRRLAGPLQAAWSGRAVEKRYLAVVQGAWEVDGVIDAPIASAGQARFKVEPSGAKAITRFRTLAATSAWTLVEAIPHTGRTHQIRVHAAHASHPLLGDSRYGGGHVDQGCLPHEFLLHALTLTLELGGERWRWFAPVPSPWHDVLSASPEALHSLAGFARV